MVAPRIADSWLFISSSDLDGDLTPRSDADRRRELGVIALAEVSAA